MATRATYQINKTTFYCHWDGYPTGAAQRFANMVKALTVVDEERNYDPIQDRRGGFEFAFIRGNLDAEPTECHQAHGDTEYRYTLTVEGGGFAKIKVEKGYYGGSRTFKAIWLGDLAEWLNKQRFEFEADLRSYKGKGCGYNGDPVADALDAIPVIVRAIETRDPGWGKSAFAIYATKAEAEKIATRMQAASDQFQSDNPNKEHYARKADTWRRALEPETVEV